MKDYKECVTSESESCDDVNFNSKELLNERLNKVTVNTNEDSVIMEETRINSNRLNQIEFDVEQLHSNNNNITIQNPFNAELLLMEIKSTNYDDFIKSIHLEIDQTSPFSMDSMQDYFGKRLLFKICRRNMNTRIGGNRLDRFLPMMMGNNSQDISVIPNSFIIYNTSNPIELNPFVIYIHENRRKATRHLKYKFELMHWMKSACISHMEILKTNQLLDEHSIKDIIVYGGIAEDLKFQLCKMNVSLNDENRIIFNYSISDNKYSIRNGNELRIILKFYEMILNSL